MHWAGTPSGRVGRGTSAAPVCETRWIVPTTPYQAPSGSFEQFQNFLLVSVGVAAVLFGMFILTVGAM